MTPLTCGMRRATGATHSGASTSISSSGSLSRRRASSGCAMSASPIQFGATTRTRAMARALSDLSAADPCIRRGCRNTGSATRLRAPRRETRAGAAPRAASRASGNAAASPSPPPRLRGPCRSCSSLLSLFRTHRGEPVPALAILAGDHVEEGFLDRLGHRSGLAFADLAPVELADRRHFRRRAGEEGLVGDVDVVARQALRANLVAELAGELDHRGARDAG